MATLVMRKRGLELSGSSSRRQAACPKVYQLRIPFGNGHQRQSLAYASDEKGQAEVYVRLLPRKHAIPLCLRRALAQGPTNVEALGVCISEGAR